MILEHYKKQFAEVLVEKTGMPLEDILPMIEQPPQPDMGDLAFPCFALAKIAKKAPPMISAEIASGLHADGFSEIKSLGPYVNAFIDKSVFVKSVLTVEEQKKHNDQKVLLEYMGGNPNKPLHVGHARNVCLGDTIRRIFTYQGYDIACSHYGDDSGVNVGYNIVGHMYYGVPLETEKKFDHYCGEVYLKMRGYDEDPEFKDRLSKTLLSIEKADNPEVTKLHHDYVKKCTIEQLRTCWRLGASFNMINWETDILHLNLFEEAIETLKKNGHVKYAEEGDAKGCWIIDLSSLPEYAKEEKQYQILVKSDGVATYVAKDIAFAMWKLGFLKKDFHFHAFTKEPSGKEIYSTTSDASKDEHKHFGNANLAITIIDNRQLPAQNVVRSSLSLMNLLNTEKEYQPLGYGVLYLTPKTLLQGGFELSDEEKQQTRLPFASRKGWTVTVDQMLDLLHQRAYEETKRRNEDKDEQWLHVTAEKIAISSLRFFLTKTDLVKDITFDIDEVLDMEGETGAYVLYTYARMCSVLTTNEYDTMKTDVDYTLLSDETEWEIVKQIDGLDAVIAQAQQQLAPHLVCRYVLQLAALFNTYYSRVNIKLSDDAHKAARLMLVGNLRNTLKKAMQIVGLEEVERM